MSANASAIGLPLAALETPALCLDLDAYRRNVARMVKYIVTDHHLNWRPHMKGQKAVELAREAVNAGAIGVTCATLYEAEAMVDGGIQGVLIANQIAGERKLARLARLQRRVPVIAATDSLEQAQAMNAAALAAGVVIPVLIELNVGMNRSGIAPGAPTVELAKSIGGMAGLQLRGLMGWEGHVLAFDDDAKRQKIGAALQELVASARQCRAAGLPIEIVSSSGSGTFRMAAPVEGITEVQAGGGVFSDLSYQKWGLDHEFALTILTRVVSRPSATRVIVDGGFKTMSVQHGQPVPVGIPPVRNLALSAEHGNIELELPDDSLRVGDTISFIPGYTDSTVCLHDEMCVLREGILEAVWTIPGRTGRR